MKIYSQKSTLPAIQTELLVVFHPLDGAIDGTLAILDKITDGQFTALEKLGALPKKAKCIRTFYQITGIKAKAVAVVGIEDSEKGLRAVVAKLSGYLRGQSVTTAAIYLGGGEISSVPLQQQSRLLAQGLIDADYVCDKYKSDSKDREPLDVTFCTHNNEQFDIVKAAVRTGVAIANGMNSMKNLGNAPSNICTPKYLAKIARRLGENYDNLKVTVQGQREMQAMKMGALLSVSKGSIEKPRLITLNYRGGKGRPIVLVGKGVTFDSGGISLKPGAAMDEMKYDMCGAGSVIGTIRAIAEMQLPINVVGVIPAVENMPSGKASKPGDIVKSMSGKTIEILNTDAEGRLILCDAMTFAQKNFKPKVMIDIATLTGAVIIALGRQASGLMTNDDALAAALTEAGDACDDRVWQLPLWEEYRQQLDSPFADLQNIGGREAGTVTAGIFLSEFAKKVSWAHLDIAGTAWKSGKNGKNKGATGRPVPLLVEYLLSQAAKNNKD